MPILAFGGHLIEIENVWVKETQLPANMFQSSQPVRGWALAKPRTADQRAKLDSDKFGNEERETKPAACLNHALA